MHRASRGDVLGRRRHLARDHPPGDRFHVLRIRRPAQLLRLLIECQLGRRPDDVEERVANLFGDVQHGVLDLVSQRPQQFRRVLGRSNAVAINLTLVEWLDDHPNPQLARIAPDLLSPGTLRRRRIVGRPNVRAGSRVEQHRRVPHRSRDRVHRRHPGPALADVRTRRSPSASGLQAKQSAAGRRNPDRPAAIRRIPGRNHTGSHGRRRAARRSARRVLQIPRIARLAVQLRLSRRRDPHLRRRRPPKDRQPRRLVANHHLRVVIGHRVGEDLRPAGDRLTRVQRAQILEQERHTMERTLGQTSERILARVVVPRIDDRVELRIDSLRPLNRLLQ